MTDKTNSVIKSIGDEINYHFNILKYYFIRRAITKIKDGGVDKSLKDQIQEIKDTMKEQLGIDETDNSILYQLIATTLDNLFIVNLKKSIGSLFILFFLLLYEKGEKMFQ